jgi:hypothetical protein
MYKDGDPSVIGDKTQDGNVEFMSALLNNTTYSRHDQGCAILGIPGTGNTSI